MERTVFKKIKSFLVGIGKGKKSEGQGRYSAYGYDAKTCKDREDVDQILSSRETESEQVKVPLTTISFDYPNSDEYQVWKDIRTEIDREHHLRFCRINWALSYTSFGIAGEAILLSALLRYFEVNRETVETLQAEEISSFIALAIAAIALLLALGGSIVSWVSFKTAQMAADRIEQWHVCRDRLLLQSKTLCNWVPIEWVPRIPATKTTGTPAPKTNRLCGMIRSIQKLSFRDRTHQISMRLPSKYLPPVFLFLWLSILSVNTYFFFTLFIKCFFET
ncbi:MAG: hypothetical protein KIT45_00480 [Fimbriimonadia bacterium]|nr:hypothetical protein [Fimbriimonadia bacterium]